MVLSDAGFGMCQLLDGAVECDGHQFNTVTDFRSVVHRLSIRRPHREIAAFTVEVRVFQAFHDASISTSIRQLSQYAAIPVYDMRVTVVVFAGDKQQPLPIGSPGWHEVEGMACIHVLLLSTVDIGNVDLVVLVVADKCAVGGC